ncbi:MAG TPA: hypothetical protein V6C76_05470 [Drouetiella sp.]
MRRMPGWMPSLLRQINWGCENSSIFNSANDTVEHFESGRRVCRQLYHFIKALPANISAVRDVLPPQMDAARLLLTELSDDERVYQNLFMKQCLLARLNPDELALETPSPSTQRLCEVMREYCQSKNYRDGILVIVVAELAATAFCRYARPLFDKYFSTHSSEFTQEEVDEGLQWLDLHTEPHTKHALWLKTMLEDLGPEKSDVLPQPVQDMLKVVFDFLECPPSDPTNQTNNKSSKGLSLAQN